MQLGNPQSPERLIIGATTRVYLWQIHFDIWQNKYNYVKFKNKIKLKKKSVLDSEGSIPEDPRERKLSTHLSLMEALIWGQWPLLKGTQGSQCSELSPDSGNRLLM